MNKVSSQRTSELVDDSGPIIDNKLMKETEIGINRISSSPSSQLDLFRDEQGLLFKKVDKKSSSSFDDISESFLEKKFSTFEIRRINREISKKIPIETRNHLKQEHSFLVKKKFTEGISRKEENRLIYIRWQLDRIDDAEFGEGIDRLEFFTENIEGFASDVSKLINEIRSSKKPKRAH